MEWLTALLAFATTMLMFAIVVSMLVEMVHRILHLRSAGLNLMLENFYDRVVKTHLEAAGASGNLDAKQFASIIMQNRAAVAPGGGKEGLVRRVARWFIDWTVVTDIPVEVFTQKLADSKILGAADTLADTVVKDIAQKYEAFGKEFSSYFESRARVFSVLIAIGVAWIFYVHPYKLVTTYFANPEVAREVAESAAETHAGYVALTEAMKAARASNGGAGDTDALKAAIDDFKKTLEKAEAESAKLRAIGVPVGWGTLDPCTANKPENCAYPVPFGMAINMPTLANGFWLLVGGLLVGLGAPFWAQAVSTLTAPRDVTRKIADIVAPPTEPAGIRTRGILATTQAAAAPPKPTAVSTFEIAMQARSKPEK